LLYPHRATSIGPEPGNVATTPTTAVDPQSLAHTHCHWAIWPGGGDPRIVNLLGLRFLPEPERHSWEGGPQ
jgi:hypothetical protein